MTDGDRLHVSAIMVARSVLQVGEPSLDTLANLLEEWWHDGFEVGIARGKKVGLTEAAMAIKELK